MKNTLTILFVLLSYIGFGQDYTDKWHASFSTTGGLEIANAAQSSTGDIYILGTIFNGGAHDARLRKYNKDGIYQWEVTYSSSYGDSEDYAVEVLVDSDDNVFTLVNVNPEQQKNTSVPNGYIIQKYNASGTLVSEYENVNDATVKLGPKAYDMHLENIIGGQPDFLYLATSRAATGGMGLEARLTRYDNSLAFEASSKYDSEFDDVPEVLSNQTLIIRQNANLVFQSWDSQFETSDEPESSNTQNIGATIEEILDVSVYVMLKLANGTYHFQRFNNSTSFTYGSTYSLNDVFSSDGHVFITGSKTVSDHEEMVLISHNSSTGALEFEKLLDADHGSASSSGAEIIFDGTNNVIVAGNVVQGGIQYPGTVTFDDEEFEQTDVSFYTSQTTSSISHTLVAANRDKVLIGNSGSTTYMYSLCAGALAVILGDDLEPTVGSTATLGLDLPAYSSVNETYEWSTGETTRTIEVTESGTYGLTVYNEEGCPGYDEVNVTFLAPAPEAATWLHPTIVSTHEANPIIQFNWKNDDPGAVNHHLKYDIELNPNPGNYYTAYHGANTSFDFEFSSLNAIEYDIRLASENSDGVASSLKQMTLRPCSEYNMSTLQTYLSESIINAPSELSDEGGIITFSLGGPHGGTELNGSFFDWSLPEGWELVSYNITQITVAVPADSNSGLVGIRIVNPCSGEATSYLTKQVNIVKDQTIDFPEPDVTQVGATPFDLGATASSGLDVTYTTSVGGIVEIENGIVTPIGAGSVNIFVNQEGNSEWNAAPQVQQTLTVSKGNDVITFNTLDNVVWTAANFDLDDLASTKSGRQITWSGTDDEIALVTNLGSVNPAKPGTITITASVSGDDDWNAADAVQQTLTVEKTDQTITFLPFPEASTDDDELYFSEYISVTSGLVVTKHSSNTSVATVDGGALTIRGAGTTTITASQAGNDYYNAAENQQQTLTVTQVSNMEFAEGSPTISHYHSGIYRLALETTEDGYVYYIVEPSGGTAPTAAQVQSGRNAEGDVAFRSDATEISAGSETTLDIYGLEESTAYDVFLVLESADNELQASVTELSLTTETLSSLAWSAGYPQFEYFLGSTHRLLFKLTEAGSVHYIVESAGSEEPSPSQIEQGQNASGASAFKSGHAWDLDADTEYNQAQISDLEEGAAYDIYLVLADESYALQTTVTKLEVVTEDRTAPEWSEGYPQMGTISSLEADVEIDLNEETGTVYYAVFNSSSTTIFPANLKNGNNFGALDEGSVLGSASGLTLTGLTEDREYDVWLVAEDADENLQSTAYKIDFTTIDDIAPIFDEGYPQFTAINETSLEVQSRLDEQVTIYAVVQSVGNPSPSVAQVLDGQDFQGQSAEGSANSEVQGLGTNISVEITGLTELQEYDVFVVAVDAHDNTTGPIKLTATTSGQLSQVITFDLIDEVTFGDDNVSLSVTSSSGEDVSYESSDEEVARVVFTEFGFQLEIVGAGTAVITAYHEGNVTYEPAETDQQLIVNKASQVITLEAISDKEGSDPSFDIVASVDSGLELTYEVSGPATNDEATISLTGAGGEVTVTVSQAGNDDYLEASETTTFMVTGTVLSTDISTELSIYPNPATDYLFVESSEKYSMDIIDLNGKYHLSGDTNETIDVSRLRSGMYLMILHTPSGDVSKRFVKK